MNKEDVPEQESDQLVQFELEVIVEKFVNVESAINVDIATAS
jgi:hypothetical protein